MRSAVMVPQRCADKNIREFHILAFWTLCFYPYRLYCSTFTTIIFMNLKNKVTLLLYWLPPIILSIHSVHFEHKDVGVRSYIALRWKKKEMKKIFEVLILYRYIFHVLIECLHSHTRIFFLLLCDKYALSKLVINVESLFSTLFDRLLMALIVNGLLITSVVDGSLIGRWWVDVVEY